MEGSKRIISKQYYKLQDLFSNVNGFFQIIYLSIFVINYVYCFTKMNEHIINDNINNYIENSEKNLFIANNFSMNASNLNIKSLNGYKSTIIESSKNNYNTVIFNRNKKKKYFSFTPINPEIKFIKDNTSNENYIINYKKIIEKVEKKEINKKFKLTFFQATHPYLYLCPYVLFSSKNKTMKKFAYLQELIARQLEINNILHKLNFIDKFEMSFFLNKKKRYLFNSCFNPKVKFYINCLNQDKDETINLDSERIDNKEFMILKDILSNEINEKIFNNNNSLIM